MTREEALDIFEHNWTRLINHYYADFELRKARELAIKALEQAPKTGHWEDCSNGWMCSECERDNREDTRYCPNCGAKMQEVEE